MDTVLGLVVLIAIILAVQSLWREARGAAPPQPSRPSDPRRRASRNVRPDTTERLRQQDDAFYDGLLIGGYLMHQHHTDDDPDRDLWHEDDAVHDDGVDDGFGLDDFDDGFDPW